MLPEEARWIGHAILRLPASQIFPLCNIGSSSEEFVQRGQPWIDQEIFHPLRQNGRTVVHIDLKNAKGVDMVGDITESAFRSSITARGFRSVICSNVLEHVHDPEAIAQSLVQMIPKGGYLFISTPYRYPYHPDPIDTMFRPSVEELVSLFKGTHVIASETIQSTSYGTVITRNPKIFFLTLIRLALPWYKPRSWLSGVAHLLWMKKKFAACCVVLQKDT